MLHLYAVAQNGRSRPTTSPLAIGPLPTPPHAHPERLLPWASASVRRLMERRADLAFVESRPSKLPTDIAGPLAGLSRAWGAPKSLGSSYIHVSTCVSATPERIAHRRAPVPHHHRRRARRLLSGYSGHAYSVEFDELVADRLRCEVSPRSGRCRSSASALTPLVATLTSRRSSAQVPHPSSSRATSLSLMMSRACARASRRGCMACVVGPNSAPPGRTSRTAQSTHVRRGEARPATPQVELYRYLRPRDEHSDPLGQQPSATKLFRMRECPQGSRVDEEPSVRRSLTDMS